MWRWILQHPKILESSVVDMGGFAPIWLSLDGAAAWRRSGVRGLDLLGHSFCFRAVGMVGNCGSLFRVVDVKRPLIREDLKVIQYQSQEADNTFITSDGTSPYNSTWKWAVKRHYREDNN